MINIDELIKNAMKSKDFIALNAYKNIKVEFEKFIHGQKLERKLDEATSIRIISSYAKKLEDAIKQFSEAHRDYLVKEYSDELEVVKTLLPAPVDASDIHSVVEKAGFTKLVDTGITTKDGPIFDKVTEIPKKEMGTVIKFVKSKLPTADGKMISEIVKKYIA